MLDLILPLAIVASSIWVYWDATSNKIGKYSDKKGMFNISAGGWAVVTLLLWIIAFPAYLIKRGNLIEKAKDSPIDVSGRGGKLAALSIFGVGFLVFSVGIPGGASSVFSTLPKCNSLETTNLVGQLITDLPAIKAQGVRYVTVKDITEQGYNPDSTLRSCSGVLVTTAGEDRVQYSVRWQDKSRGQFYVEAQLTGF